MNYTKDLHSHPYNGRKPSEYFAENLANLIVNKNKEMLSDGSYQLMVTPHQKHKYMVLEGCGYIVIRRIERHNDTSRMISITFKPLEKLQTVIDYVAL